MALNNCLYVVGGWDGQGVVKSVEMFNPTKGVWQEVSTHPNIRMKSGVAALDGKIYVVRIELFKPGFTSLFRWEAVCRRWSPATEQR